jgi:hypothetical protein
MNLSWPLYSPIVLFGRSSWPRAFFLRIIHTTFHTNGLGGSAFEEWIEMGMFSGLLDLTSHGITSLI